MNFKLIKAGVAAVAMLTVPLAAQAADVPIKGPYYKGPPRTVVSYYNWTGFYAGLNAGYGFGTSTWSDPAGTKVKPKGGMFGVTAGYNWQSGAIVYGIEGDYDWSMMKGSVACDPGSVCETKNSYLATFRGRLGYAFDRWLPYLTVGAAYGNIKAHHLPDELSASKSKLGWTGGVGVEYAFLGNWTAKVEYLYVDLGSFNTGFPTPTVETVSFKANVLRAGLNYKFSGPIFSRF